MLKVAVSFGCNRRSKGLWISSDFRRLEALSRQIRSRSDLLRSFAGCFKIGIRTGLKSDGNDLPHVGALLASSPIDTSIGLKVALDAAVVIHHEVGILPVSA